jgi:PAS domain S-box-containing protein
MPNTINLSQDLDDSAGLRRFVRWNQAVVVAAAFASFLSVALGGFGGSSLFVPATGMVAVALLSHWQLRRSPERAVMVLVLGAWSMACASTLLFSGVHTAVIIIFPFSIAMAGWILGERWLLAMTLATVLFLTGVGVAEMNGSFHPTARAPTIVVTVSVICLTCATAFLAYAARLNLWNSRTKALQLAAAMAQKNEMLALRERDLKLFLNNVPAAVASFDAQGRLRRCNPRYASMFGRVPSDIVGKPFADYATTEIVDQVRPFWKNVMAGQPQNYRRSHHDMVTGVLCWIDGDVLPEMQDGVVIGMFAVFVDVTDKVRIESEILTLNAELEQRVASRSAELAQAMQTLHDSREELVRSQARATLSVLVASVSHELSTPIGNSLLVAHSLADVSTELQHQLDTGQLKKSTLTELNTTLQSGGKLMVNNLDRAKKLLSNFKQVSADQASEQRRVFDLAEVVSEVVSSLSPSLKNSPHKVVVAIAPGVVMDSFPGPLGQVLINLINNAYLHAFEGRGDGVLTIGAEQQGDLAVVRLADNGVGMAPDVLAHLFEPFFSTKVGHGGTGLGMAIVDRLVRKTLGGTVQVESAVGQGTAFELSLPLTAPTEPPDTEPAPLA